MAKLLKLRRGSTSDHSSFTGAEGEVTVDTTKDSLVVHDGSTAGGHAIAKSADLATYVPLAGGTLTGNIVFDNDNQIQFQEATSNGNAYVGLKAPTDMGATSSYTITLPNTAPGTSKVLKTNSSTATQLEWATDVAQTLLDEDNFSSDSNTQAPTQQSTKAYIAATSQPLDADLTALAGCQTGSAAALALLTSTEIAALDGFTGDKDDLIYAKDLKATGVTSTEFDYLDGVTSAIQTQIDAKGVGDATKAGTNAWTGVNSNTPETLTSAATITIDFSTSNNFKLETGHAAIAFANPTTEIAGASGSIFITQGSTTCAAPTWGDQFLFSGGTAPSLTGTTGKIARIDYIVQEAGKIHCVATDDLTGT